MVDATAQTHLQAPPRGIPMTPAELCAIVDYVAANTHTSLQTNLVLSPKCVTPASPPDAVNAKQGKKNRSKKTKEKTKKVKKGEKKTKKEAKKKAKQGAKKQGEKKAKRGKKMAEGASRCGRRVGS